MRCPYCSETSTRVVDSRLTEPGDAVRRRRECEACGQRFTTYERSEPVALYVVKRDGASEAFDREKLLNGLLRAATKRPVEVERLEAIVDEIAAEVRTAGGELAAERVGELALRELITVDRVAAIRFASVYRRFDDLAEFQGELERLESEPETGTDQLPLDPSVPTDEKGNMPSPRGSSPRDKISKDKRRRGHAEYA